MELDELTPEQQEAIKRQLGKGALMDEIFTNPKTNRKLLELIKEHKPNLAIPALDVPAAVERDVVAPAMKRIEESQAAIAKREAKLAEQELDNTLRTQGFTPDEITEGRKLVTEGKILDVETAVGHVRLRDRAATPRPGPSPFTIAPAGEVKAWLANPVRKAREEAYKAIAEFRR